MSELNREQIIKALEWCSSGGNCMDCLENDKTPHLSKEGCMAVQMRNALALIKELTEENKVLAAMYSALETSHGIDLFRAREEAIDECKARLQKYYQSLHGTTLPMLVAYHIEEVFKEIKRGMTGEES